MLWKTGKPSGISKNKILNKIITRDILVEKTTDILDMFFLDLEGDKVIQIGSTINRYGEEQCCLKHIVTLDTCNPIPGSMVVPCQTEEELLKEWFKFIRELDPDIVTGYNIFGFDFKFIYDRARGIRFGRRTRHLRKNENKELVLEERIYRPVL